MPLTHVCIWDDKKGYRHISLEEASRMFPQATVEAQRGIFKCDLCGQNIGLSTTRYDTHTRYFFHSSGELDKTCEDRQKVYDRPIAALNSHAMPIRIKLSDNSYALQLGFFLPSREGQNAPYCRKIIIMGDAHTSYEYSFARIESDGITYLDIGRLPRSKYLIKYEGANESLKKFWATDVTGIEPAGALFDAGTGRMLRTGGKAYAEREYYLLKRGTISYNSDIESEEKRSFKASTFETWRLYRIRAKRFSRKAASFFLQYSIFLVATPVEFYPVWPVSVNTPYFLYHENIVMYFYMHGAGVDLKTYPAGIDSSGPKYINVGEGKLYQIYARQQEQLLSLGNSGAIGFTYLMKKPLNMQADFPAVDVSNNSGTPLDQDSYTKTPPEKYIMIKAPYDGKVEVFRGNKLNYIYRLRSKQPLMVDIVALGTEIRIFQGCDIVRTIIFGKASKQEGTEKTDLEFAVRLDAMHGDEMDLPHSAGALAHRLTQYPKTRQWLVTAIRKGKVSRIAYRTLSKFCYQREGEHKDGN